MRTKPRTLVVSGLLLATSAGVQTAIAAELEEVVVTAQRREQNVQDVGIAITAVTGQQIRDRHYTDAPDLVAQAPNVEFRRQFPARGLRSNYYIRGVGSTDFNDATETPVAVYVDDFYMISPSTADFALLDVARAEILRGPQGTLFGRNSNGGAIQFVTNRPELGDTSAGVDVTAGSYKTQQIESFVNIPLSDRFAMRLAGMWSSHDHYTENTVYPGHDVGDQNFYAGRVALRYKPSDDVDVNYKFEFGRTYGDYGETDPYVVQWAGTGDGDIIHKANDIDAYGFNHRALDVNGPGKYAADGYHQGTNEVQMHNLRINWQLTDRVAFTSISGFLTQSYDVMEDCDGLPTPFCNYEATFDPHHFTQEFRLNGDVDRLNWTAGLYYLSANAEGHILAPLYFVAAEDPSGTTSGLGFWADYKVKATAYAAFGQLEYAATDAVTLVGGLRFGRDERNLDEHYPVYNIQTSNSIIPFSKPSDFQKSSHVLGSKVADLQFTRATAGDLVDNNGDSINATLQVNWKPADGQLYYASVRRGVKAAGFNSGQIPPFTTTMDQIPIKEEVLLAYEIGEKVSFMDDRVRLNSAVFYYDYKDMQIVQFKELGQIQTNVDGKIKGAEFEIEAVPVSNLTLNAGLSLLDTQAFDILRGATDPVTGTPLSAATRELGEAPKVKVNAMARYEWNALGGQFSTQLGGTYTAKRYTDALNFTAGILPSYINIDGQVGYVTDNENLSVLVWARNLTNKRVPVNTLLTDVGDNISQQKWNEPRLVGVTVGYRF